MEPAKIMKNVTYLLGAGASIHAIPIVENLNISIEQSFVDLRDLFSENSTEIIGVGSNPFITEHIIGNFIEDYNWVITNLQRHQSVDTLAKKLYIQGEFEYLKKLKTILSFYMIIRQSQKSVDLRYDSFFASIFNRDYKTFPSKLKILSWNYDYQLEKAYAEYSRDHRIDSCQAMLNVVSKYSRKASPNADNFGVLKLNGTASFMLDTNKGSTHNYLQTVDVQYDVRLIYTLIENYVSLLHLPKTKDQLLPSLSFAWEDYDTGKPIVVKAIEFVRNTEILVVIGYSFPFFNRLVDRDIINSMRKLEKVYFQAPDANNLKERFLAIRDDIEDNNLIIKTDTKQFVFPNEF